MKGILQKCIVIFMLIWLACVCIAAGPPATITVTATPSIVPANGNAYAELIATVKDSSGVAVDDGTSVNWSASGLGIIDPISSTTTGGIAKTKINAPVNRSTTTITATAGAVNGSTDIKFVGSTSSIEFDTNSLDYFLIAGESRVVRCRVRATIKRCVNC